MSAPPLAAAAARPRVDARRALAVIAAAIAWGAVIGLPLLLQDRHSTDWVPFMVAGNLIVHAPSHLYDQARELSVQHALAHVDFAAPGRSSLRPIVAPPWDALLSAPFAAAGFAAGGILWLLAGALAAIAGVALIARTGRVPQTVLALAGLPALLCVMELQMDGLVVLGLGLGWRLLSTGSELGAGAALGLTLAKPHLALALAAGLLVARRWRILAGWLAAGLGLVVATALVDPRLLLEWPATAAAGAGRIGREIALPGLAGSLGAGPAGMAVASVLALAFTLVLARGLEARGAAAVLICGGVLAAPHAEPYDLVLVAFALVLAGDGVTLGRWLGLGLGTLAVTVAVAYNVGFGLLTPQVGAALCGSTLLVAVMIDLRRRAVRGHPATAASGPA